MNKILALLVAGSIAVAPAANAAPAPAPNPKPAIGSSAGAPVNVKAKLTSIFQNKVIWVGQPNPNPPSPQIPVWTFKPLNAVAWVPFLGPGSRTWNWWNNQSSQRCVFGISTFVGPYGTAPGGSTPSSGSITHQWSPNGCA